MFSKESRGEIVSKHQNITVREGFKANMLTPYGQCEGSTIPLHDKE